MNQHPAARCKAFGDTCCQRPDNSELTVLIAMHAWLRPRHDCQWEPACWRRASGFVPMAWTGSIS